MKKLLLSLLSLVAVCAFGADAANDVVVSQRKSDNSGFVQRNVTPVANSLFGFNGSLVAANVTTGSNLSLSSGVLNLASNITVTGLTATTLTFTNVSGTVPSANIAATLTGKRVQPRVLSITSNATPTINTDSYDMVKITAQAAAITSMTTNLTGTPDPGDMLLIRIKDDGTARAITWGSKFAARGAALRTTTTAGKYGYDLFIWNDATSTWDCVSTATES